MLDSEVVVHHRGPLVLCRCQRAAPSLISVNQTVWSSLVPASAGGLDYALVGATALERVAILAEVVAVQCVGSGL